LDGCRVEGVGCFGVVRECRVVIANIRNSVGYWRVSMARECQKSEEHEWVKGQESGCMER